MPFAWPCAARAGNRPTSQKLQPVAATFGIPPIQHATVLTDRRHVLTKDAEGNVQMLDVTSGTLRAAPGCACFVHMCTQPAPAGPRVAVRPAERWPVEQRPSAPLLRGVPAGSVARDFGAADLKEVERQLFEPSQSVFAWFAPEVKLGSLAGSMEAPACFGAEIYAQVGGGRQERAGCGAPGSCRCSDHPSRACCPTHTPTTVASGCPLAGPGRRRGACGPEGQLWGADAGGPVQAVGGTGAAAAAAARRDAWRPRRSAALGRGSRPRRGVG